MSLLTNVRIENFGLKTLFCVFFIIGMALKIFSTLWWYPLTDWDGFKSGVVYQLLDRRRTSHGKKNVSCLLTFVIFFNDLWWYCRKGSHFHLLRPSSWGTFLNVHPKFSGDSSRHYQYHGQREETNSTSLGTFPEAVATIWNSWQTFCTTNPPAVG